MPTANNAIGISQARLVCAPANNKADLSSVMYSPPTLIDANPNVTPGKNGAIPDTSGVEMWIAIGASSKGFCRYFSILYDEKAKSSKTSP